MIKKRGKKKKPDVEVTETRKENTPDEKPTEEEAKEMTPAEYFSYVKSKKNEMTEEKLRGIYEAIEPLAKRFSITGQTKAVEKLRFLEECLLLELPVVEAGYTQFVYRWDLEEYIDKISDKSVFIVEMRNFEREFPDEVIEEIIKAKEVFGDNLYVVFTDYTKKVSRSVAKERREKDPILFGAIVKNEEGYRSEVVLDRLYYICDWSDHQCDLTLSDIAAKYSEFHKNDSKDDKYEKGIVHNVVRSDRDESLNTAMAEYAENDNPQSGIYYVDNGYSITTTSNSYPLNSIVTGIVEDN